MSIKSDHIHILVELPPHISLAEVVRIFKGGTGLILRKEFPEMEEFLGARNFGRMDILPRR